MIKYCILPTFRLKYTMSAFFRVSKEQDKIYHAYRLLKVEPGDTADKIHREYRKMAITFHPDRLSSDPEAMERATEKMKEINQAYSLIKHAPLDEDDTLPEIAQDTPYTAGEKHTPGARSKVSGFAGFRDTLLHFVYGALIGTGFSFLVLLLGMPLYKKLLSEAERLETVISTTYIAMGVTIVFFGVLAAVFRDRFLRFIGRIFTKRFQRR